MSRDVRVRRRDADWFVHFRADAPANAGFALSDSAFALLCAFGSGAAIEDVVDDEDADAARAALRPLVDAGVLLTADLPGSVTVEEILRLRAMVAVSEVGLLEAEAVTLYALARSLPAGAVACELGSMTGGSTVYLAAGVRAAGGGRLVAVDDHEWHRHLAREAHAENVARFPSTLPHFEANLARAGVADLVELRLADTAAAGRVNTDEISLLFVDAGHEEADVRADLDAWLPHVPRGMTVAIHDYGNPLWPAVERVADSYGTELAAVEVVQTLALFTRR